MIQFTGNDFAAIAPQAIVVVTALIVLLWDVFFPRMGRDWLVNLTLAGLVGAGIAVWKLWPGPETAPVLHGMISPDLFSAYFNAVFLIGAGISVLLSAQYLRLERVAHGEYYALLLLSLSGMMVLGAAVNLITLFLGIEILSIAMYVLAGYHRDRLESQEAALKYFFLGGFASAFLLYGIALIYGATGSLDIGQIVDAVRSLPEVDQNFMLLGGIALLLVGFGFKVAAVPFHVWAPDVYEGAPTPITAYMSVGVKAAAFAALTRVFIGAFQATYPGEDLSRMIFAVLASVAALTMLLGNVVALVQPNFKRMLAYSSIAHAGYMLLGVVAGIRFADSDGVAAVMFYALAYTFTNLGAFGVALAFRRQGHEVTEIADLAGLGHRYPGLGILMTLFMLSLAGFPLTGGFLGKFFLFKSVLHPDVYGLTWLAIVGVLTSVVSFYFYLGVVKIMYLTPPDGDEAETTSQRDPYLNLALAAAALGTLILGLLPASFVGSATQAAAALSRFVQQAMR